ncbi:uncharacterized protein [Euphorbia lathyris]|uniref:uncharacterized protein isoform X8 n=1 Tax=Euphorbia lathyris TaxID=212925 RepID=UPI0033131BAC
MRRDGRITLAVAIECVTTLGPHSNGLDEFGSFVLRLPEFKFRKCTNNFLPISLSLLTRGSDEFRSFVHRLLEFKFCLPT